MHAIAEFIRVENNPKGRNCGAGKALDRLKNVSIGTYLGTSERGDGRAIVLDIGHLRREDDYSIAVGFVNQLL